MPPEDITAQDLKCAQDTTFDHKTVPRIKNGDIALQLATELDADREVSPELERRVRRKADFILLPLVSCTATLSFLDKVSNKVSNNFANNVSWVACHETGQRTHTSLSL